MKRLLTTLIFAALLAADTKQDIRDTAKRNAEYQRLAGKLDTFVAIWAADCKAKGQALQQVSAGKLDCVAPAPPPPKADLDALDAKDVPRKELGTKK